MDVETKKLIRAYRETFCTPDGKLVLADMLRTSRFLDVGASDPTLSGRRDMVVMAINALGFTQGTEDVLARVLCDTPLTDFSRGEDEHA